MACQVDHRVIFHAQGVDNLLHRADWMVGIANLVMEVVAFHAKVSECLVAEETDMACQAEVEIAVSAACLVAGKVETVVVAAAEIVEPHLVAAEAETVEAYLVAACRVEAEIAACPAAIEIVVVAVVAC